MSERNTNKVWVAYCREILRGGFLWRRIGNPVSVDDVRVGEVKEWLKQELNLVDQNSGIAVLWPGQLVHDIAHENRFDDVFTVVVESSAKVSA